MSNKRKLNRRHSIYYLRVYDRNEGNIVGHLVDISETGVMLVCDQPIATGTHHQLSMQLPGTINDNTNVDFDADCRWCTNDTNPNFYDAGFSISTPTPVFLETLEHLIDAYMFKDPT